MAELARGQISDRPWGQTFGRLGARGLSGQVTIHADGRQWAVAFQQGAVVGATSPLANDSAVRIALTGHLLNSTQVSEVARLLAATPGRDECEVIGNIARLSVDQVQRLRRRAVAQRAARTFAVERGEFVVEDHTTITVVPGSELDVRAVLYLGARQMLSEERLLVDLVQLGEWFQLRPETIDDLPQYGFTESEKAILSLMVKGASLAEISNAGADLDRRTVRAIVYSLAAFGACETTPPPGVIVPRTSTRPSSAPPPPEQRPRSSSMPIQNVEPHTRIRSSSMVPPKKTPTNPPMPPPEPKTSPPGPPIRSNPPTGVPQRAQSPTKAAGERHDTGAVPVLARTDTSNSAAIRAASGSGSIPVSRTPTGNSGPKTLPPPMTKAGGTQPPVAGKPSTLPPAPNRGKRTTAAQQEIEKLVNDMVPLLDRNANHFEFLGVPFDAPPDAVRTAYFTLARKLHPDRLAALGVEDLERNAQRLFAQINTAFATLSDPLRRREYIDVQKKGGASAVAAEDEKAEELALRVMRAEEAFRQGEMALRRDQYKQAVEAFSTAVELAPNEAEYQALLAWAKFAAAPDKKAVASDTRAALQKADNNAGDSVTARFYLGRVERMLGREKEALNHFQNVLMMKPHHAEAASEARILEQRLKGRR